jgi:hypothetical protein
MSKRAKRTAVPSDDVADKSAPNGDDGNPVGGTSEDTTSAAAASAGPGPIDPTTGQQPAEPDSAPRRRGRPPGSGGNAAKAKPIPLNVTGLEKLLVGIHGGLAILSGREEWSLDTSSRMFDGKTEAEFLAQSAADVARHYGGIADQKTLDWFNLVQCLAMVYGARIYAIRSNPKPKPAPRPQGPQAVRTTQGAPQHHPSTPANSFDPDADPRKAGTGEIPGIGAVEFPDGHPLKPKLN